MWRTERFNYAGGIVSNLENIIQQLEAAVKIHLAQKSEGHVNGHELICYALSNVYW